MQLCTIILLYMEHWAIHQNVICTGAEWNVITEWVHGTSCPTGKRSHLTNRQKGFVVDLLDLEPIWLQLREPFTGHHIHPCYWTPRGEWVTWRPPHYWQFLVVINRTKGVFFVSFWHKVQRWDRCAYEFTSRELILAIYNRKVINILACLFICLYSPPLKLWHTPVFCA